VKALMKDENIDKKKFKIPIFFHNGRSYDLHLLIDKIGTFVNKTLIKYKTKWQFQGLDDNGKKIWQKPGENVCNMKLSVIAQNSEKYIAFKVDKFQFLDSFQFLSDSLEKLSKHLSDSDLVYFRQVFQKHD